MGFIYGLVDPRHNCVRYVGKTDASIEDRLASHMKASRARQPKYPVHMWLKSFGAQYIAAAIELECTDETSAAELKWIQYFGRDSLLNLTAGGTGGNTNPWKDASKYDIHRQNISSGLKTYWSSLTEEEKARRPKADPQKLSELGKKRYSDPAEREATRLATMALITDDYRLAQSLRIHTALGTEPFNKTRPCLLCNEAFTSSRRATMTCAKCRHEYSWMKRRGEL